MLERLAATGALPVINAMTSVNHPCEVLADLYALSRDADITQLRYLFIGADGNIARAWWEAAQAFGLDIR
ncbi:MAG: ornithine carbamoyltransferase, partial [Cellulomonadaceae bacterium]